MEPECRIGLSRLWGLSPANSIKVISPLHRTSQRRSVFYALEPFGVFTSSNSDDALKGSAHRIRRTKPAGIRDLLKPLRGAIDQLLSSLNSQAIDKLPGFIFISRKHTRENASDSSQFAPREPRRKD